jgi:hypothetical protein
MEKLTSNGVNGATGNYLMSEITVEQMSKVAQGEPLDKEHIYELKNRYGYGGIGHLGVKEGVDPKNLAEAGWGVIFAYADGDEVEKYKEALQPLLVLRAEQAGTRYQDYSGVRAYRPRESKNHFLVRHGIAPGPADPDKMPYYLLIVGSPEMIPYRFQYQLAVQYAVGRIHFDNLEDFARYAESVVAMEKGEVGRSRTAAFFGVHNQGDIATRLSSEKLVKPLADWMAQDKPDWNIRKFFEDETRKSHLANVLVSDDKPALLFTASHGMGFPKDDMRQLKHQGALLCRDWPGPLEWGKKPIPESHYFSGDDIGNDAKIAGLLSFHFACYSAGTPLLDDFAHRAGVRLDIASHPFIAQLSQRLLAHPNGGALATVGHVERAWSYSFHWPRAGTQLAVFESMLKRLMEGHPIGSAMEFFNEKYAELSTLLSDELEEIKFGAVPDNNELVGLWTANNDARSYIIIGDPAVRLAV